MGMSMSREEVLYAAAEAGRFEDVQHQLSFGPGVVDVNWAYSDWWRTPLIIASANGHASVVTLLFRHGADDN